MALHKIVIDGSGAYANNSFDVPDGAGNFTAQNVTDGSSADEFGINYWLGREGVLNEFFTLDLGGATQIQEIHLRNTHNTSYNDRGTARFQIFASQSIDAAKQLVQPTLILSGTLTKVSRLSPIPADKFTATNGLTITNARYLKFVALTANNIGNNVGLNEIEVYAAVAAGPDRAYAFEANVNDTSGHGFNGQNTGGILDRGAAARHGQLLAIAKRRREAGDRSRPGQPSGLHHCRLGQRRSSPPKQPYSAYRHGRSTFLLVPPIAHQRIRPIRALPF